MNKLCGLIDSVPQMFPNSALFCPLATTIMGQWGWGSPTILYLVYLR